MNDPTRHLFASVLGKRLAGQKPGGLRKFPHHRESIFGGSRRAEIVVARVIERRFSPGPGGPKRSACGFVVRACHSLPIVTRNEERCDDVYRGGAHVGTLRRTTGGCVFRYLDDFFERHQNLPGGIATRLPYRVQEHRRQGDNLHPFFAGLLPEGRSPEITATRVNHRSLSEVRFQDLWRETIDRFNQDEPVISGVQEKISPAVSSFPIAAVSKRKGYILKLNPIDKPRLVENERSTYARRPSWREENSSSWLRIATSSPMAICTERTSVSSTVRWDFSCRQPTIC